jgi:hypothetical protein
MNWQQIAAQVPPVWNGNLDDDCTAKWAGFTLRAEWMNDDIWWWCVYDDATGEQVTSSNSDPRVCHTGEAARRSAEDACRQLFRFN